MIIWSIRGAIRSGALLLGVAATTFSPAQARRAPAAITHRSTGSPGVSARDPEDEVPHAGIEPDLRHLVAHLLGVDPDELVPEASLIDDLAADSLDLVELAIVLESTFGITLTRQRMDEVRSYRDLLDAVMTAPVDCRRKRELVLTPGLDVKSRLVPPGASEATLERADALTAYAIEMIREDALGSGPGTHLEVTLPALAGTADLASVRDALAGLDRHGIAVSVRCDTPASAAIPVPPAT
jgi:acyl carrier protein